MAGKNGPKVLFIDIETAPVIIASWATRPPYAGAVYVLRDTYILMASYKWAHERAVKVLSLPDFPRYRRHKHDDTHLCRAILKLLDTADIVIAHNGDAFDIKKINSRLITNKMGPPSPFKTVDTLKAARRVFKFDSNKLDNIGRYLEEGRKLPNTGAALWKQVCEDHNLKAWETMRRYCRQDTSVLSNVYGRFRPWIANHPNMNLYDRERLAHACPTCQSTRVQRRGILVKLATRRARFQCQDCGHWFAGGSEV